MNISFIWAGITKSVSRLAMAWTVRGSNPREDEIFRTHSDRSCGTPNFMHKGYRGLPGGNIYIYLFIIIFISIQPLGQFGQEPGPSQATGMALIRCILGKFLGVVLPLLSPSF
jgi:hypothetical protein